MYFIWYKQQRAAVLHGGVTQGFIPVLLLSSFLAHQWVADLTQYSWFKPSSRTHFLPQVPSSRSRSSCLKEWRFLQVSVKFTGLCTNPARLWKIWFKPSAGFGWDVQYFALLCYACVHSVTLWTSANFFAGQSLRLHTASRTLEVERSRRS